MAITRLPTSTINANYVFTVELDGVEFKLSFKFNGRDDAWYFSILDTNDVVLRAGLKVVNEWTLLRLWAEANRPGGEIIAVNQGNVPAPPTLNQLGAEVVLTYLDSTEIAALG
jgi:hypothetical protein